MIVSPTLVPPSTPDARLLNPLVVSALTAAMAIAVAGIAVAVPENPAASSMIGRLAGNLFVRGIVFVGIWAFLYGLLQLWGVSRGTGREGLATWVSGRKAVASAVPGGADATLGAGIFLSRWDLLATRRMAPLSYAIWVLPLLGFIGTVIGISDAIGGLGNVFADADRQEALQSVLGALRFAFDTTFAGLLLVIPVMALSTWLELAEERARDTALMALISGSGVAE